jgi:hypothetical protein
MLYAPKSGLAQIEENVTAAASTEPGTIITAAGSAHTKGAFSAGQLIAATAAESFGITIFLSNVGTTATTNTRSLVDIGVGASGSESVLIPNLMCGQAGAWNSASSCAVSYTFPIYIAAGTRLSARSQSLAASDTVNVTVFLHQYRIGLDGWVGSQVTAYGPDTATSSGISHTPGNAAYATTTQLTASSAAAVRYLQVGIDLLTDTSGSTLRGLLRIAAGSSTNYVASDLPFRESTTLEFIDNTHANLVLSRMGFDFPIGSYLGVGAQQSAAGEARGWALYGVD